MDNIDDKGYLSVFWIKVKKIKAEIDGVKNVLGTVPNDDDGVYLKNLVNKLEIMINEGDLFLREKLEENQLKGQTGYFDRAQIEAMIKKTKEEKDNDIITNNSLEIQGNQIESHQQEEVKVPPKNIMPKEKLRLKPVGEVYNKKGIQLTLANNKIDGTLYVASLSDKKVLVQPQGIKEVFTDEVENRVLSVATTSSGQDKFFIDTLNKKIISGPISGIKEIIFVQRYQKVLLAQIITVEGKKTFLDIDKGEMISEQDVYQYLT